jgi:UDP-N-acetylmuramoylalanine--D-glutamate ligase
MEEIVKAAHEIAQEGDVVLLSCADASFGMFKDYKDRGNQFKKAVQELS